MGDKKNPYVDSIDWDSGEFYNKDRKRDFVAQYTESKSTTAICASLFKTFAPYENEWGKDLASGEVTDVIPIMEKVSGVRYSSSHLRKAIIKDYVRFCLKTEVPDVNKELYDLSYDTFERIRTGMVPNPLALQRYLDATYSPEEDKTVDNTYRCVVWMLYSGIQEKDIAMIKGTDIDFRNMVIRYGGKTYAIYRYAVPALSVCAETRVFNFFHPNYGAVARDRTLGDVLVRGFKPVNINSVRVILSKKVSAPESTTNIRLSPARIWLSGAFYRLFEEEQCGISPNFQELMRSSPSELDARISASGGKREARILKGYQDDYAKWKIAFFS